MGKAESKQQPPAQQQQQQKLQQQQQQQQHSQQSGNEQQTVEMTAIRSNSSVIMGRVGSTPSTDRPFKLNRSKVSFHESSHPGEEDGCGSGSRVKSWTSRGSRATTTVSVTRSEYHQTLKPDLVAGLNKNLVFATFIIVFGSSFLFGYNIGVLNNPKELITSFYNKTYEERYGEVSESTVKFLTSLTTALFIPGGMIGSFLGGWLADTIGRKKTILFSHVFSISGAVISCACVAAKAPEMLMIGRVLVGVNSGLGNCIAPMFLSEIAPFNLRGAFGTLHQLSVTLGIMLSSVFGVKQILGTEDLWPYLILLEAFPAIVSLIVLPFLPDSPRYLLLVREERDQAVEALEFYRATQEVDNDMEEMDTEFQKAAKSTSAGSGSGSYGLMQLLKDKELRRPLIVACMLQVIQQFSGINAVFFFSSTIFADANVADSHIPFAVIGTNAVNVLMTVIAVPLMDVAGRVMLLLIPMIAMIVDLIVLTICFIIQDFDRSLTGAAYVTVACVVIYVIAFAVGLGPIPMMIGAELFRQGPRPKAMACAGVVNWIGTFIVALSFESIAAATKPYTFIIFIVLLTGFVVFTKFFVPETKNKTFEEIAHQFAPGGDVEVEVNDIANLDDLDDVIQNSSGLPGSTDDDFDLVTVSCGGPATKKKS